MLKHLGCLAHVCSAVSYSAAVRYTAHSVATSGGTDRGLLQVHCSQPRERTAVPTLQPAMCTHSSINTAASHVYAQQYQHCSQPCVRTAVPTLQPAMCTHSSTNNSLFPFCTTTFPLRCKQPRSATDAQGVTSCHAVSNVEMLLTETTARQYDAESFFRSNQSHTQLKLPRSLWEPKVHYRIHNSPSLGPILSQINPVHVHTHSVALVRERTIPTERPPPVGEVSANFCG